MGCGCGGSGDRNRFLPLFNTYLLVTFFYSEQLKHVNCDVPITSPIEEPVLSLSS